MRHRYRRRYAGPLLDELEKWLRDEIIIVAPKSLIGTALAYTLALWPRLRAYTLVGRFLIDSNKIGNTIRPLAIGRKNDLFVGSDRGARHATLILLARHPGSQAGTGCANCMAWNPSPICAM